MKSNGAGGKVSTCEYPRLREEKTSPTSVWGGFGRTAKHSGVSSDNHLICVHSQTGASPPVLRRMPGRTGCAHLRRGHRYTKIQQAQPEERAQHTSVEYRRHGRASCGWVVARQVTAVASAVDLITSEQRLRTRPRSTVPAVLR